MEYLADGNEHAAERLSSQPGWVIDAALERTAVGVFAAHLSRLDSHELPALKLGKKTEQLLEEATRLHKQIDRYAYGAPPIRFGEQDVDQARAAGVLIEFDGSAPVITDRAALQGAVQAGDQAHRRGSSASRPRRRRAGAQGRQGRRQGRVDPQAQARREHGRRLRVLAEQAHGANLDLGWALRNELASVDDDMTVARSSSSLAGCRLRRQPRTRRRATASPSSLRAGSGSWSRSSAPT